MSALENIPQGALWLPNAGLTDARERAAQKAVNEYDERLTLGQRRDTGEWVVFLKRRGDEPFPVLGLGRYLPEPNEVTHKLWKHDTVRRGDQIMAEIMKRQDAAQKKNKDEADERSGVMAEALEHGFRKQGAHPSPRVFIPASVRSV